MNSCGWCFCPCDDSNSLQVTIPTGEYRHIHTKCLDKWEQAKTGNLKQEKTAIKQAIENAEKGLNKKERKAVRQEKARRR